MLRSLRDVEGYAITATDGEIGSVVNFLFDDERWAIRYLVVKTGGFFSGRRVLISPIFFGEVDWSKQRFHVALTMDQVKNSPSIDVERPVSRQHEREYYGYYGYPYYWGYPGLWGVGAYPRFVAPVQWDAVTAERYEAGDEHLRSVDEVRGYHIQGLDDAIGHVADFIVDDETWKVRYLVIDTSNWWFGKNVLVAPEWARSVSWSERKVHLDLTRQAIKDSPEWDAASAIERDYEARLYDHYGRPTYWDSGVRPDAGSAPHTGSHPT